MKTPWLWARPSNTRDWSLDQARLPSAEFNGDLVTIRDIRNFQYRTETDYTPGYYDKTFDLRKLESAWFVVEPFSGAALAHTFVSFGFGGNDFVAISVEIRKEKGESFSPIKGMLRQYEVMYVIGDERDLIKLRTNYRDEGKGHTVYLYPMRTTRERMQAIFTSMLRRANELREHPEFYNTITNTCTTNLVKHVNQLVPRRIPWHLGVFLPGYSDKLAYKLGLIDTTLPFEQAREHFRITDRARALKDDDPEFSVKIRAR